MKLDIRNIVKNFLCIFLLILIMINIPFAHANRQKPAPAPIVIIPDNLTWSSFDAFPPGAKAVILAGDPRQAGPFMLRVKIPPNYKVAPNWQTATVYVTVLSGRYHIGIGDKFNPKYGKTLPSAGSVIIPADSHLYFWTNTGAVLEIHGIGPWEIHYVNSADDPRNH